VAELYKQTVNASAGVLGRPLEFEIIDAGAAPSRIAAQVRSLVDNRQIDALIGWHISSVREVLTPVTAPTPRP